MHVSAHCGLLIFLQILHQLAFCLFDAVQGGLDDDATQEVLGRRWSQRQSDARARCALPGARRGLSLLSNGCDPILYPCGESQLTLSATPCGLARNHTTLPSTDIMLDLSNTPRLCPGCATDRVPITFTSAETVAVHTCMGSYVHSLLLSLSALLLGSDYSYKCQFVHREARTSALSAWT